VFDEQPLSPGGTDTQGKFGGGHDMAVRQGDEIAESAEEKGIRLVREELKRLRWSKVELTRRRKGDEKKVKSALRLRRESTMTLAWMARRLHMGTKTHLSHLLYWHGRRN
jgi:hypothetical protein